jgi:hypothetical protein
MDRLAQIGTIAPPPGVNKFGGDLKGLPAFLNVILRSLIMIAGIYALLNFIIAGYGYISAGGDSEKIKNATAKIWQSILGLVIVAGSFALAAIIGLLFFGEAGALIDIKIFGP